MAAARGATLLGPDKLELHEYPMPEIPADGGLVKVEMGGVCGTDVKYLHGKLQLSYPIILGHEILGRVEKLGRDAAQIHKVKEGDRIILKGALGCGRGATRGRREDFYHRYRTRQGSAGTGEKVRRSAHDQRRRGRCGRSHPRGNPWRDVRRCR